MFYKIILCIVSHCFKSSNYLIIRYVVLNLRIFSLIITESLPPQLRRLDQLTSLVIVSTLILLLYSLLQNIANNPMEHFVFKYNILMCVTLVMLTLYLFRIIDKLTNLTTLNLSNCGVSSLYS